ncbi:MAG: hypothetical protein JW894_08715 [Bacteroidales bacterium]|nr:hypothetical protein [Bacteroidales bacterium]
MNAEIFWLGCLKVTVVLIIIAGVIFTFFSHTSITNIINYQVNKVFFIDVPPNVPVFMMQSWLIGVMGAIMAGWGCTMLYLIVYPFRKKESWSWRCMFYSVVFWFILDSGISGYHGAVFNVVINCILFLQIMAPLLFLRNSFFLKIRPFGKTTI